MALIACVTLADVPKDQEVVSSQTEEVPTETYSCTQKMGFYLSSDIIYFRTKNETISVPAGTHFTLDSESVPVGSVRVTVHSDDPALPTEFVTDSQSVECSKLVSLSDFPIDEEGYVNYTLPTNLAGKGKSRSGWLGNCYAYVKSKFPGLGLSGASAYTAAAQLSNKGWKKYTRESAPVGSICVCNKGGINNGTTTGHLNGHIEIKKKGGYDYGIGVQGRSGCLKNKRPFIGCYHK